jgi:hypothetical protein
MDSLRTAAVCAVSRPFHPFESGPWVNVGSGKALRNPPRPATSRGITANNIAKAVPKGNKAMRAEIQTLVDEIKQSLGLLRRHL